MVERANEASIDAEESKEKKSEIEAKTLQLQLKMVEINEKMSIAQKDTVSDGPLTPFLSCHHIWFPLNFNAFVSC